MQLYFSFSLLILTIIYCSSFSFMAFCKVLKRNCLILQKVSSVSLDAWSLQSKESLTSLFFVSLKMEWMFCSSLGFLGEGQVGRQLQVLDPSLTASSPSSLELSSPRGHVSRCLCALLSLLPTTPSISPWSSACLFIASTVLFFSRYCLRKEKCSSEWSSYRGSCWYTWGIGALWVLTMMSTMASGIVWPWISKAPRCSYTHLVERQVYMQICILKKRRLWMQRALSCWAKWTTTRCRLKAPSVSLTFTPLLRQLITIVITLRNIAEKPTLIGPCFHQCYLYFPQTQTLLSLI